MVIRLGAAFGFTGPYSRAAETQRQGVRLAVDEINADGGILGEEVKIVERDTELAMGPCLRATRELLDDEDVDLLVANLSAENAVVTSRMAASHGVAYMAGCQTTRKFHREGFMRDTSFTPYTLNVQSMRAAARFAYDQLGDTFHALVPNYEWGKDGWRVFRDEIERIGGEAHRTMVPLGVEDITPHVDAVQEHDPAVIVPMGFGDDQKKTLRELRSRGMHEQQEIIVPVTAHVLAQEIGTAIWDGVYAGVQYHPDADADATRDFAAQMRDRFDTGGDAYAAATYTGAMELARGADLAGSLDAGDIAAALTEHPRFAHTKTEERWRACDNQSVQDWFIVQGNPEDVQASAGDLFDIIDTYGGEDLLPRCGDY